METRTYLDRILNKIHDREIPLGTVVNLSDPMITEILATTGIDFVWIDLEHSAMSAAEVNMHILAARSRGVAPFVRVPWNDPVRVKPILEMGPAGVIFPFINSEEEARSAMAACRYPGTSNGVRGFCPHRANGFGSVPLAEYLERASAEPWVILQIEHIDAVEAINEICSVPGIGSLLLGPFDLSASIGKTGQVADPEVQSLIDRVVSAAGTAGVPFGAFSLGNDEPGIARWIQRGVSWLALDMEYSYLTRGMTSAIETVGRLSGATER